MLEFTLIVIYHVGFESSSWQATPGKKYVHLMIVNGNGDRINVLQAVVRIFSKFISLGLVFSGFFMIYFRADRKGLHDIIAKTQVIFIKK